LPVRPTRPLWIFPPVFPLALVFALVLTASAPAPAIAQALSDSSATDSVTVGADGAVTALRPAPPGSIEAKDTPNDAGGSITVRWVLSPDDAAGGVTAYRVLRAEAQDGRPGEFTEIGGATAGQDLYQDGNVSDDRQYFYKVVAANTVRLNGATLAVAEAESAPVGPVRSSAQWFNLGRINVFVGVLLLSGFIVYYIRRAQAGKRLFIRKIAGLEAVDEAVGRATEMGKKIFYVPGISDMDNVQTIAAVTILSRVAEMSAQYEARLDVPVARSLVMVTSKEVVKEAYLKAGRPDSFHEDQVHYLTDDQFGYAAGIDGMVTRERPATIFYMGQFFAESLVLAETGNSIGAIQIAGTAEPAQLPFFVASCDYTLIGEELFAASAYLSREPRLLGSLKGQDIGKAIILIALIIGLLLETFGNPLFGWDWHFSNLFSTGE